MELNSILALQNNVGFFSVGLFYVVYVAFLKIFVTIGGFQSLQSHLCIWYMKQSYLVIFNQSSIMCLVIAHLQRFFCLRLFFIIRQSLFTKYLWLIRLNLYLASPIWLNEPEDVEAALGESAKVMCVAYGAPVPKITWKKKGNYYKNYSINIVKSLFKLKMNYHWHKKRF